MCTFATGRRPPRGAALVIVMSIMAVLLLGGTAFLTISSTEVQIAENQHAAARAFASAEAGLHRAIARLSADPTYAGESNVTLGSGTVSIGVAPSTHQVCLSRDLDVVASVGVRGGQAQARIRATADQAIYPFRWGFFAAGGPLILSSLDTAASPRSRVDSYDSRLGSYDPIHNGGGSATVGARGNGVVLYHVDLVGGAAGEWVTSLPTPATHLGRASETPVALAEPSATWSEDPNVAAAGTLTLAPGTHYYLSLTLGDEARVLTGGAPVTLYVRGNVEIGANVVIGAEPGEKLLVIANSGTGTPATFRTGENFRMYGGLYGTNTNVVFGDGAIVHGSVIGRRISGPHASYEDGPCCNQIAPTLRLDRAMASRAVCTQSVFTVRRGTWREILP
jgi:hypothetical protein